MRVRARFTKTGAVRYISAIDLGRVWERGLRKADVPIAYSEGFSPHPKVSFPDALPLGYASVAEYCELVLAAPVPVDALVAACNGAFPDGLRLLAAVEVPDGAPRLARWLQASLWELAYDAAAAPALSAAVAALLAVDVAEVERERKGEVERVDIRPVVAAAAADGPRVRTVLLHPDAVPDGATRAAIRPTEVDLALRALAPAALPPPRMTTRLAQGAPTAGGVLEALSGHRVPIVPDHPSPTSDGAARERPAEVLTPGSTP